MNTENYRKNPKAFLEEVLRSCRWERVASDLWERSRSRLFVDHIGIFFYRFMGGVGGSWVRICGLSHDHLNHLQDQEQVIYFDDGIILDLMTGE